MFRFEDESDLIFGERRRKKLIFSISQNIKDIYIINDIVVRDLNSLWKSNILIMKAEQ